MSEPASTRTIAARAARFVACALALGLTACGDARPPTAPVDAAARIATADAGVDWMLAHWREMPPGWAYANLSRLARVIATEPRATRLASALREDLTSGVHLDLPEGPFDAAVLDSRRLTPILLELQRRRDYDLSWRESAETIGLLAKEDELGFWKSIPLRQRSTVVHLFDELEIPSAMQLEAVTEALRRGASEQNANGLGMKTPYVYAITHVVLARSGYFERLADPRGLEFAIPVLRGALAYRTSRPIDVFALDQICEVLTSLQLLGVPDDEQSERARSQVVALQNADGSWGTGDDASRRKIHPTFNAIVALLDLQSVLPDADLD